MRDTKRVYKQIDFPPLTKEQEKEIEGLVAMKDEDIKTDDIPVMDFSDAVFYYSKSLRIKKERVCTTMDYDNVEWLKKDGKGYQTRLNAVVRWARMNGCPIENFS